MHMAMCKQLCAKSYEVASISRLLKIMGLFCKRAPHNILQKRPTILRSLLIVATPYVQMAVYMCIGFVQMAMWLCVNEAMCKYLCANGCVAMCNMCVYWLCAKTYVQNPMWLCAMCVRIGYVQMGYVAMCNVCVCWLCANGYVAMCKCVCVLTMCKCVCFGYLQMCVCVGYVPTVVDVHTYPVGVG